LTNQNHDVDGKQRSYRSQSISLRHSNHPTDAVLNIYQLINNHD